MRKLVTLGGLVIVGLLFLASMAAWIVGSFVRTDTAQRIWTDSTNTQTTIHYWIISNTRGAIRFDDLQTSYPNKGFNVRVKSTWGMQSFYFPSEFSKFWQSFEGSLKWVGQGPAGSPSSPSERVRFILVPWWSIELILAAAWLLFFRHYLKSRSRFRTGLCQFCGYDLRATPDLCPECGRQSAGVAAAPS